MQDYQRLLASQSVRRLNPAKVCESAALKTKLVDTIAFLESLAVKDSNEKDIFFKRLPVTLPSLPLPVVQRKVCPHSSIAQCHMPCLRCYSLFACSHRYKTDETCMPMQLLPMLASALEYGGAPSLALGALLQIGKTLDADAFAAQVVPALSKLFTSSDRTIRRSLLESIDTYGTHFSEVVHFVLVLYTCPTAISTQHVRLSLRLLQLLWPLTIALGSFKDACSCAECCGKPSVPACGNRLLRQQCILA